MLFLPATRQFLMTQIRHPLPRLLSVYHWLKNRHAPAEGGSEAWATLEDFLFNGDATRYLQIYQFGVGYGRDAGRRAKMAPAEMHSRAIEAIEVRTNWFGIAEYFEESLYTYAALCGLPSLVAWTRDQRNPDRPLAWDLPPALRARIEEAYEHEFHFYAHARDLFLRRLADLRLEGDIEVYREACAANYKDRLLS